MYAATIGDAATIRPYNAANGNTYSVCTAVQTQAMDIRMLSLINISALPSFDYKVSGGGDSLTVYIVGFDFYV